jgi:hypothetical protein
MMDAVEGNTLFTATPIPASGELWIGSVAGKALKSASTLTDSDVSALPDNGAWRSGAGTGGTDPHKFSLLPNGARFESGAFFAELHQQAIHTSSTVVSLINKMTIVALYGTLPMINTPSYRSSGAGVRCIRD